MVRTKFDQQGNPIGARVTKGSKTKESFKKGQRRTWIAEQKPLSSRFINLGHKNPRVFSFPHIEGAALAHQVRVLSKPFDIKQNADNTEISEQFLAKTKMEEFAEAFLTTVPNRFLRALLKVSGLDNNFPRLNGKRKELLTTLFEALKQSFLPNESNSRKLSENQKQIIERFKAEKKHRRGIDKQNLVSKGLSDKALSQIKNTWQSSDKEFAIAA